MGGMFSTERLTHSDATDFIKEVIDPVMTKMRRIQNKDYFVCGSYRRNTSTTGDIDIVVFGIQASRLRVELSNITNVVNFHRQGNILTVCTIEWNDREIQVDFNLYTNKNNLGAALIHSTGSAAFNNLLRYEAKKHDCKLNQYGLYDPEGKCVASKTEKGIFSHFDLKYIPPEERDIDDAKQFYELVRKYKIGNDKHNK